MSQEKVDRYKEYKKNKDKILKHEKRMRQLEIGIAAVVAALFVAWFGWSVYHNVTKQDTETAQAAEAVEIDMNAYDTYVSGLQSGFTA